MMRVIALLSLLVLAGCQSQPPAAQPSPPMLPEGAIACPEPRPEQAGMMMCTMDYRPVCGVWSHGMRKARQSYGNACSACDNPDVIAYTEGGCP